MRLLAVELRRYFSRWTIRAGLAVLAGVLLVVSGSFFVSSGPPSAEELSNAQIWFEQDHADWEENGDEWEADCRESEAADRELMDDPDIAYDCDNMEPKLENYLWSVQTQELVETNVLGTGIMLAIPLVFALAITYMAGEFSSGTMSTWLTFVPQRQRVYFSKLATGALTGFVIIGVTAIALWGAARGIIAYWDIEIAGPDDYNWIVIGQTYEPILRFALIGVILGICGVALATVVRHTAGAMGVAVGYLIIELTATGIHAPLAEFSLIKHVESVMMAGTNYYLERCESVQGGTVCEYIEQPIEFSTSLITLIAVAVVVAIIGAWQFQRRDVN